MTTARIPTSACGPRRDAAHAPPPEELRREDRCVATMPGGWFDVTRRCCWCSSWATVSALRTDWNCTECGAWHGPTECLTAEGLPLEGLTNRGWGDLVGARMLGLGQFPGDHDEDDHERRPGDRTKEGLGHVPPGRTGGIGLGPVTTADHRSQDWHGGSVRPWPVALPCKVRGVPRGEARQGSCRASPRVKREICGGASALPHPVNHPDDANTDGKTSQGPWNAWLATIRIPADGRKCPGDEKNCDGGPTSRADTSVTCTFLRHSLPFPGTYVVLLNFSLQYLLVHFGFQCSTAPIPPATGPMKLLL